MQQAIAQDRAAATPYTLNPITIEDDYRDYQVRRLARWVAQHEGMLEGLQLQNGLARGVTIQIECLQVDTRETWTEYTTVWTMKAAREALGY